MSIEPGYLQQLTIRLATGLGRVSEATRSRHADYIKAQQRDDGGWGGRMGPSDLYYASFALRSLAVLGELRGEVAERACSFLTSRLENDETLVDHISLVYGAGLLDAAAGLDVYGQQGDAWKDRFSKRILTLRRDDGGFAKGTDGAASSTYYTFLSLLCLELIERPCPDTDKVVKFILSQFDAEGGFREIRVGKRPGTNPTAAAIGVLRMLKALDDHTRSLTAEFLADMQDDEGGLLANSRIPIADLLSTFTGVLTLADLNQLHRIDIAAARHYVSQMERPNGGFLAAFWDETCDVEYTFYGLGCLALLS